VRGRLVCWTGGEVYSKEQESRRCLFGDFSWLWFAEKIEAGKE
jgi:hypothetical protein